MDISLQIAELHRETQEIRYQFLNAEIETCYTTLDFGGTELAAGSRDVAIKEAEEAAKGIETIKRFLPELDDAGQRSVIQVQLEQLQRSLAFLRRQIDS